MIEFNGLVAFFSLFVAVLVASLGIAYYAMREQNDDLQLNDSASTSTAASTESNKKDTKKSKKSSSSATTDHHHHHHQQSAKNNNNNNHQQQQQKVKVVNNSNSNSNSNNKNENNLKEEREEEPIVIIPDPFTRQITSRFAAPPPPPQSQSTNHHNNQSNNNSSNNQVNQSSLIKKEQQQQQHQQQVSVATLQNLSAKNQQQQQQQQQQKQQQTVKIFDRSDEEATKVKPKATVKPNQTVAATATTNASTITAAATITKAEANTNKTAAAIKQQQQHETNNEINLKQHQQQQEMFESAMNEKQKTIHMLNSANEALKQTIKDMKADLVDFESFKLTNQVIQKEIAKWSSKCKVVEKEKAQLVEKHQQEIGELKRDQLSLLEKIGNLERSQTSNEHSKNLQDEIYMLQGELARMKQRAAVADESYKNKLKELNDLIVSLEAQNIEQKKEKQILQTKLDESNEMNKRLSDSLQSNDDYIKKIDAQLSSSMNLINELKNNENQLDAQHKLLQAKQDAEIAALRETIETRNQDLENLKNLNRSLIEKIQPQPESSNSNADEKASLLIEAKEKEIKRLNEVLNEMNEKLGSLEAKMRDLEMSSHELKRCSEELEKSKQQTEEKMTKMLKENKQLKCNVVLAENELEHTKRNSGYSIELNKTELKKLNEKIAVNEANLQKVKEEEREKSNDLTKKNQQLESQLKKLSDENERLKSLNFNLRCIWESAEQSLDNLEKIVAENETKFTSEINAQKSSLKHLIETNERLESSRKQLADELDKEIKLRSTLEKKFAQLELLISSQQTKINNDNNNDNNKTVHIDENLTNEHHNGYGKHLNGGHHSIGNDDSDDQAAIEDRLEKLRQENESLRRLIDEELKSSKLLDRSLLRNIIKMGQEAFEKEKSDIERFEEKLEEETK